MNIFTDNNHENFWAIALSVLVLSVIVYVRYLIFSGVYHQFFFSWFQKKFQKRLLRKPKWKKTQIKKELLYSLFSGVIFSFFIILSFVLYIKGYTKVYLEATKTDFWYMPFSIFLVLFVQDTYYYWIHRWMHKPSVYKYFHLVHHKSIHTSVFTSFSFHPFETILQAILIPLIVVLIPLHLYAVVFLSILMTVSATINHAGVEIYPSGKFGDWFKKWIIGASHHDKHHTKFNYNYGLYFTFWDRLMGTELANEK